MSQPTPTHLLRSSTTETSEMEETMSEHGLRQFTCADCGWTSSDIGTFPNLAIPLCWTCDSDGPGSEALQDAVKRALGR